MHTQAEPHAHRVALKALQGEAMVGRCCIPRQALGARLSPTLDVWLSPDFT